LSSVANISFGGPTPDREIAAPTGNFTKGVPTTVQPDSHDIPVRRNAVSFVLSLVAALACAITGAAQIGSRFPSEKKTVVDPVHRCALTFLTSKPAGDSKIYQTHHQWTSDGKWLVFRSNRVKGQAMAVNESTETWSR